jgi:hypothetical protein
MTIPAEIVAAIDIERRRCIGVVLKHYGIYRLAGEMKIAEALDALATELEHGDGQE